MYKPISLVVFKAIQRPAKLLVFEDTSRALFGGGQRITLSFLADLSSISDLSIVVYDRAFSPAFGSAVEALGIEYIPMYIRSHQWPGHLLWAWKCTWFFLKFLIRGSCFVAAYTPTRISSLSIGAVYKLAHGRFDFIWIVHEHMLPFANPIASNFYCWFLDQASIILYCSNHCRNQYARFMHSSSLERVYGGSVVRHIPESGPNDHDVRKVVVANSERALADGFKPINLIYAGKVSRLKGAVQLAKLFSTSINSFLRQNYFPFLYFVGNTEPLAIREIVAVLAKYSCCYHVFGPLHISRSIYDLFDVGVFTSWYVNESLALVPREMAITIGRVLTSNTGALSDVIHCPCFTVIEEDSDLALSALDALSKSPCAPLSLE